MTIQCLGCSCPLAGLLCGLSTPSVPIILPPFSPSQPHFPLQMAFRSHYCRSSCHSAWWLACRGGDWWWPHSWTCAHSLMMFWLKGLKRKKKYFTDAHGETDRLRLTHPIHTHTHACMPHKYTHTLGAVGSWSAEPRDQLQFFYQCLAQVHWQEY